MTDRIDHAADARKNLAFASEALQDADVEAAQAILSIARVQATLALVEQQRIANEHAELANRLTYLAYTDKLTPEHASWIEEGLGL